MAEVKAKRKFRFPILLKTAIIIFVFSAIVVEIAMTYYSLVMSNRNTETYKNYADSISSTISKVIDPNDFNAIKGKVNSILDTIPAKDRALSDDTVERTDHYMSYYEPLESDTDFQESFNRVRDLLREIVDSNTKFYVDCAYLSYVYTYVDDNGVKQGLFVYLCDSAEEEYACPPGWLDPVFEQNRKVIDDPERGFPAYFTNTNEYGYLVSSGTYVQGTDNGYAFVDILMNAVRARQASSIVRLFVYLVVTVNLIAAVGVLLVYFIFHRPLKRITEAAKSFNNKDPKITHENFVNLKVKSHDELNELAESIKNMENGVVQRFNEIIEVNEALLDQEKQTEKMTRIANRDSLTGVGSKTAYDYQAEQINVQIANKEKLVFGLAMIDLNYLKNTNDEFGHVAGDDALVRLANIICLVFKHSPVYRVGGDEFVVILKDEDYRHSEDLIDEFNERITDSINNTKLPQYERISAAIGYAEYDEKLDRSVDDVFARADQKMYQRKHVMKDEL